MATVNIEQIALSVIGMMNDGTDMERGIQDVTERMDLELSDKQKDLVRERVQQHQESREKAENDEQTNLNSDATSTTEETNPEE